MKTRYPTPILVRLAAGFTLFVGLHAAATDISTVPLDTYSAPSSTDVKPNLLFVLDDSGSMDWDYMPDWANSSDMDQFRNSGYNGLAYNPAIVYTPPVSVDSSGNVSRYPSMTGTSASTGGDSSATTSSRNWKSVKNDAYGIQSTASSDLDPSVNSSSKSFPYFFTTIPGEYCSSSSLKNCTTTNAASDAYNYPAYLRWCDSTALTNCKAGYDSASYTNARMPTHSKATITISGNTNTSVTSITVDGNQINQNTAAQSSSSKTLATNIANQINNCTYTATSACAGKGYIATASGSVVTIYAPGDSAATPVVTPNPATGGMTFAVTAFAKGTVPGQNLLTTITPANDSYPYPGSSSKAASRTDCAGTTCTRAEEMTNYANWWTYYRTRMQMMKTAVSNSFSMIDTAADIANGVSRYRVGYMTINGNQSNAFLNLGEFAGSQKYNWYQKLIAANPNNSTPLRVALSDAGRLYAGKLNGSSLNGVTVTDPLQYSCQQNYTLLSTDGFWNSGAGYKMNGTTAVGNQDGGDGAPYGDGGTAAQPQIATSTLQTRDTGKIVQSSTSQLQTRTITATSTAPSIQTRTSSNGGSSWTGWSNTSSCTPDASGNSRRDCQFYQSTSSNGGVTWTAFAALPVNTTCAAVTNSVACSGTVVTSGTAWTNTNSCSPTSTVFCQYVDDTAHWVTTDTCTSTKPTSTPYDVGLATICQQVTVGSAGTWTNATGPCTATVATACQYSSWSSWSNTASCTAIAQSTSPNYTVLNAVKCQTLAASGGTSDTLADVAAYYYKTDLRSPNAADGTGTCTGPTIPPATTPNDLCANNVPPNSKSDDKAETQHMTTFTLGLGAEGKMVYAPTNASTRNYWDDTSGDFYAIRNRQTVDTANGICSWQSSGICTWPVPSSDSNANIDDLWHAAVNGRGSYFSARDPASLASGLTRVLKSITEVPRAGTAAAAASSNPNVSISDNFVFSSSYESVTWWGEVIRQTIDQTGALSVPNWSAMRLLDCATTPWKANTTYVGSWDSKLSPEGPALNSNVFSYDGKCYVVKASYSSGSTFDAAGVDGTNTQVLNADESATTKVAATAPAGRTIFTKGSSGLIAFTWDTLGSSLQSYFKKPYINYSSSSAGLSQFCPANSASNCLSASAQAAADGQPLVDYLRGDRTNEGTYFRKRTHVLGDIVASEGRYVKVPLFNYADSGYGEFKSLNQSRKGVVYVAANDGMLHAFDAETGRERWGYIPSMVLPDLYKLADMNYANQHQFFVDNTPEVGEICGSSTGKNCAGNEWKTILVGGLNRGGKGYYALDVTDPTKDPVLLWEFTDSRLGYTYGNPRITKLKSGQWVVILSSGYNNSDGKGYIFVLDAKTGAPLTAINGDGTISTGASSGAVRVSAHTVTGDVDNTTTAVYGGDEQGNLWRFDVNNDIGATGYDAQKLVSLVDASGNAQPITAKPITATINGKVVVFVGTGRYLGVTDIGDTKIQSFYAVKDPGTATTFGNPRVAINGFVQQIMSNGTCGANNPACTAGQAVRTSTSNAIDWSTQNGWFLDFLSPGERAATDASLGLGTLVFTTNVPSVTSGTPCGDPTKVGQTSSYLYALNFITGAAIDGTSDVVGVNLGFGTVTRPVMIELADGTVRTLTRISNGSQGGNTMVGKPPIKAGSSQGLRRVSWRELTTQ